MYPSISCCQSDFDFSKAIADKEHLIRGLRKQKYHDVLSGLDNVDLIEASVSFISSKILRIDNGDAGSVFPTMTEAMKLVATSFNQDVNKLTCCVE